LHYTASGIITLIQVNGLKLLKYNSTKKKNVIVKQKFCASSWLNTEIKKVFLFYGLL